MTFVAFLRLTIGEFFEFITIEDELQNFLQLILAFPDTFVDAQIFQPRESKWEQAKSNRMKPIYHVRQSILLIDHVLGVQK